eukprot:1158418-Pelagomonas_calceolata.AAC.11
MQAAPAIHRLLAPVRQSAADRAPKAPSFTHQGRDACPAPHRISTNSCSYLLNRDRQAQMVRRWTAKSLDRITPRPPTQQGYSQKNDEVYVDWSCSGGLRWPGWESQNQNLVVFPTKLCPLHPSSRIACKTRCKDSYDTSHCLSWPLTQQGCQAVLFERPAKGAPRVSQELMLLHMDGGLSALESKPAADCSAQGEAAGCHHMPSFQCYLKDGPFSAPDTQTWLPKGLLLLVGSLIMQSIGLPKPLEASSYEGQYVKQASCSKTKPRGAGIPFRHVLHQSRRLLSIELVAAETAAGSVRGSRAGQLGAWGQLGLAPEQGSLDPTATTPSQEGRGDLEAGEGAQA